MFDVVEATYQGGVFKPDVQLPLADSTRVRLIVETAGDESACQLREHAWQSLQQLWQSSTFDSGEDRLGRGQRMARD